MPKRISAAKPSPMSLLRVVSVTIADDFFSSFVSYSPSIASSSGALLAFLTSEIASPIFLVVSVANAAYMITLIRTVMKAIFLSSKCSLKELAESVETCFLKNSSMI